MYSEQQLEEASKVAYAAQLSPDEVFFNMGYCDRALRARYIHKPCEHEGCYLKASTKLPLDPHQVPERFCKYHKPQRKYPRLSLKRTRTPEEDDEDVQLVDDDDVSVVIIERRKLSKVDQLLEAIEIYDDDDSPYKMPDECEVCFDNAFVVMLEPCKHWLCKTCVMKMADSRCPFCRTSVELPEWLHEARDRDMYLRLCRGQELLTSLHSRTSSSSSTVVVDEQQ